MTTRASAAARYPLDQISCELIQLFGRRLKEIRPLGTDVRILFTFAPDRTLVLLYAGDKSGEWNDWYRRAIPEAAGLYRVERALRPLDLGAEHSLQAHVHRTKQVGVREGTTDAVKASDPLVGC